MERHERKYIIASRVDELTGITVLHGGSDTAREVVETHGKALMILERRLAFDGFTHVIAICDKDGVIGKRRGHSDGAQDLGECKRRLAKTCFSSLGVNNRFKQLGQPILEEKACIVETEDRVAPTSCLVDFLLPQVHALPAQHPQVVFPFLAQQRVRFLLRTLIEGPGCQVSSAEEAVTVLLAW